MLSRKVDGAFNAIFKELKEQDFDGFKGVMLEWTLINFEDLVHLLSPILQKQDTNMRECKVPKKGAVLR